VCAITKIRVSNFSCFFFLPTVLPQLPSGYNLGWKGNLRAWPPAFENNLAIASRAIVHHVIAPPTPLYMGLEAKVLIKSLRGLQRGASLVWFLMHCKRIKELAFFIYIWWMRLKKKVC
jgi:hypothetical protein